LKEDDDDDDDDDVCNQFDPLNIWPAIEYLRRIREVSILEPDVI
jgi:hypothetical protein